MSTIPPEGQPQIKFEVDDDSELIVRQYLELLDEGSKYWDHLGAIVERLSPGISPFDRRETVDQIVGPLRMVITDAFW